MDTILKILNDFLALGPSIVIPVFLIILGILIKMKFSRALRGAVLYGIGFIGILVILDLLLSSLGAAAQALVERTGLLLEIVDVGWPVLAAVAFGVPTFATVFLAALIMNLVLFAVGLVKTLDIDFFNYYHFTLAATVVYFLTHDLIVATIVGGVLALLTLKVSDWSAPFVAKFWELPGISTPTMSVVGWFPFSYLMNWIIDRIPGLNKVRIDSGNLQKRLGVLGEPMMLGLIVAILLGIGAGYNIAKLADFAIKMAASMVLLPRMIGILMEGLTPFSQSASKWMQERFPGREVLIGLDAAVLVGKSEVLVTALIMVPITILLALILPGNRVLPFADLATIPFWATFAVGTSKGNIFRSIIILVFVMSFALYGAGFISPTLISMGNMAGFHTDITTTYTAIDAGMNTTSFFGYAPVIFSLIGKVQNWVLGLASIILGAIFLVLIRWVTHLPEQKKNSTPIGDQAIG